MVSNRCLGAIGGILVVGLAAATITLAILYAEETQKVADLYAATSTAAPSTKAPDPTTTAAPRTTPSTSKPTTATLEDSKTTPAATEPPVTTEPPVSTEPPGTTSPESTSQATTFEATSEATSTITAPPINHIPPPVRERINCFPEQQPTLSGEQAWNITKEDCENRGCSYDLNTEGRRQVPICYMHPSAIGYEVTENCTNCDGYLFSFELAPLNKRTKIFDPAITKVKFTVKLLKDYHLQIKITDMSKNRFEVPFNPPDFKPSLKKTGESSDFKVEFNPSPFSIKVTRKKTGAILFDSSLGGFVFSDRFLQITSRLGSANFYGLGEHEHPSLKHNFDYKTWPMFARDQPGLGEGFPLYGVHPMYMVLEEDGNAHGVFLMNSNAMEYSLIPTPGVVIRTIGGIFDFHIYIGPTPEKVVQQHTEFVGRPYLPPYWSLGFHLARWGYNSLDNMAAAVNRTREYSIPLDVIYADIDHMDRMQDFTLDEVNFGDLPTYLSDEKEENGLRSVIILDPAITNNITDNYPAWNVFEKEDCFIKWPNGSVMMGYVWPPGKTAFPDFFLESTRKAWKELIVNHSKVIPFDGVWIDMNEPANFGTNEKQPWNWPQGEEPWSLKCPEGPLDDPPYRTYAISRYDNENQLGRLSDKTICMVAKQNNGTYDAYDVHSLYGWSQSPPTIEGLREATQKRGFVLSRSTFAGSSHYVSHWLGDNVASWTHLRRSIIGMLEMSLFGMPHTGPDICGFINEPSAELCRRWMQLGAFYPYSRNHNVRDTKDQDPGSFGQIVGETSRRYMTERYKMLPYLYTLFYEAHLAGSTVARPLFHEFPTDHATWAIDAQFMLGSAVLVIPILDEGAKSVKGYLPKGKWLDKMPGLNKAEQVIDNCYRGSDKTFGDTTYLQRGGTIMPHQAINDGNVVATKFTRHQPLWLDVVFDCNGKAEGKLFWDDGESLKTIESANYYLIHYTASYQRDSRISLSVSVVHQSKDHDVGSDLGYSHFRFFGLAKNQNDGLTNSTTLTCGSCNVKPTISDAFDAEQLVWTVDVTSNGPKLGNQFEILLKWI